ncbi:MAG: hypothetical protein HY075_08870 [Deltaproteobacteria bacterium]|nr:hypothetical protein [Deltaproteobacteria bacterium]
MLKKLGFMALAAALGAAGCSSVGKVVRDRERMATVKRIAVAGFVVAQERKRDVQQVWRPADGWRAYLDSNDLYAEWVSSREPVQIENIYLALGATFERELHLGVVAPGVIVRNPVYHYLSSTSANRPTKRLADDPSRPFDYYAVKGVVTADRFETLRLDERRELLRELGVDALAAVEVRIYLGRPIAFTSFKLFDGTEKDPIWVDELAVGREIAEGVFPSNLISAAESSFQALVSRYRAEK